MMRIITTIKFLFLWAKALRTDSIICGAFVNLKWFDEPEAMIGGYYISFSADPAESDSDDYDLFDDYGYPDDDVFYYMASVGQLINLTWRQHIDGWRIHTGTLNTATDIEVTD